MKPLKLEAYLKIISEVEPILTRIDLPAEDDLEATTVFILEELNEKEGIKLGLGSSWSWDEQEDEGFWITDSEDAANKAAEKLGIDIEE